MAPGTEAAVKLTSCPKQTGELMPGLSEADKEFTVTWVIPAELEHPVTIAVTEYDPASEVAAPAMLVF